MIKKIFTAFVICSVIYSCQTEQIDTQEENLIERAFKKKKETLESTQIDLNYIECNVIDADRAPNSSFQPTANFWWSETSNASDYNDINTYFSSDTENSLVFREYEDGTANILGSSKSPEGCVVQIDVWLKDKRNWTEWQAYNNGLHKKEGTAGNASTSGDMNFYVIDSARSTITATGDCAQEGEFGLEQRPDPNDLNTPNYGSHVGPGGANYDSNIGANGLSSWGWLTDITTGERLWLIDFNFRIECPQPEPECETSFAKGNSNDDHACFDQAGFSRWGWNIGPLSEGTYTYDVYAGAGQCDITKGALVGTVTITYDANGVSADYDLLSGYYNSETHLYAGTAPFPVKNNGSYTVAPGQYYVDQNLSGAIYVIAHAVVCEDDQTGG